MLDQATIAVIKSTIPLLESAGPALTQHFYQRMFSHNPELKDIFNLAHQRSGGVGESGGCDERRMAGHAPIVPPYFCAAKTRGMG